MRIFLHVVKNFADTVRSVNKIIRCTAADLTSVHSWLIKLGERRPQPLRKAPPFLRRRRRACRSRNASRRYLGPAEPNQISDRRSGRPPKTASGPSDSTKARSVQVHASLDGALMRLVEGFDHQLGWRLVNLQALVNGPVTTCWIMPREGPRLWRAGTKAKRRCAEWVGKPSNGSNLQGGAAGRPTAHGFCATQVITLRTVWE